LIAATIKSTRKHEWFSTHLLFPSVSWRDAGLYRGMAKRTQLAAFASRDETSPGPQYGLNTSTRRQMSIDRHGVDSENSCVVVVVD